MSVIKFKKSKKNTTMLDQLMQMLQQNGGNTENTAALFQDAQQTITNGLQGLADTGELNTILTESNSYQEAAAHPSMQGISSNLSSNLMEKFGLNKGMAGTLVAAILPMILSKLMSGKNASNGASAGGFDLGGLLGSLTGGSNNTNASTPNGGSGGIMDTLSGLGAKFGLDKDGDGDVDMNDLIKMFK
jgi:hypothetical protein